MSEPLPILDSFPFSAVVPPGEFFRLVRLESDGEVDALEELLGLRDLIKELYPQRHSRKRSATTAPERCSAIYMAGRFNKMGLPGDSQLLIRQHAAALLARSRSSAKMSSSRPSASAFENARRDAE